MRNKTMLIGMGIGVVMGLLLATVGIVLAGSLNPSVGPGEAASQMYTVQQIYDRLTSGAAGTKMTSFTEPSSGPGSTMVTLDDIMAAAPAVDDANGAAAGDVLTGTIFWGLTSGQWGGITGTMPNNGAVTITPTTTSQSIALGYHNGSGLVTGDADLTATNIISDAEIFGVTGTYPLAAIPATGVTDCYDESSPISCTGTGQDGETQTGVPWTAASRYTDNGDGTVTDNLTQLIWLQDVACITLAGTFTETLTAVSGLQDGQCGLSDGSTAGDWRVPNVKELQSMMYYGSNPSSIMESLPDGTPFYRSFLLGPIYHWSSTVRLGALFYRQEIVIAATTNWTVSLFGWPVRGGQ